MPAAKNSVFYGLYARIALDPICGNPYVGAKYAVFVSELTGETSGD
jgi:hypothetical protein